MKLMRNDKVIVILGRDKGKTGTILGVIPKENKVIVENINMVKRHTKPSQKAPRGGILNITKAIDASKVMVVDPDSGKPARIGYQIKPDGSKERIFKVSANFEKQAKKAEKSSKAEKTDKLPKGKEKSASPESKAGKK